MHVRRVVMSVVAVLSLVTGCTPIEEELTRTLTFTVEKDTAGCATSSQELDVSGDTAVKDNKQFLKSIEVTEVKLTITDAQTRADAVATVASGKLVVSEPGATEESGVEVASYQDLAITTGSTATLVPSSAGGARMGELLLESPNKATVHAEGCVESAPAGFILKADVTLVVKAGI
ncbi:MAG: hypothetical protein L0Y66_08315 [Myxococcaceae bacterium]|nr:hypothetical protein [Myxococcaceae bacterium]MCI0671247.1 hypothetical protein [Myxococcaceae bacterium]